MKRLALLLIAAAMASPAAAQSTARDQQYEADRRRAELAEHGARADAQAAAAQRAQAQQRYVLRQTEPVPVTPRTAPPPRPTTARARSSPTGCSWTPPSAATPTPSCVRSTPG